MARGRKKKTGEAATREPSPPEIEEQENAKEPTGPTREPVSRNDGDEAATRELRYYIVKGAFTAGTTVIGPKDKHRPGDEPGQMRPEYTPGGVEALEHWVKAGFMVKK